MEGKTVLVTGSMRRIGRTIAWECASRGARVILHARCKSLNDVETMDDFHKHGLLADITYHNLENTHETGEWFQSILENYGTVDSLINAACDYPKDNYSNLERNSLETAMAVQVLSPLIMMRMLAKRKQQGSVVNILDSRIADRAPNHVSYHMAKRSLYGLTRDLALEYAPYLRINAVAPGIILPPAGQDDSWLEHMQSTNPMQSYGNPDDVSNAVQYLIQASFVTGQIIYVDGGRHLKGSFYGS